jgi:hypothetical protein
VVLLLIFSLHGFFGPGHPKLLDLATKIDPAGPTFHSPLITAASCSTWCRGFGVWCAAAIRCAHQLRTLGPFEFFQSVLVSFWWLAFRRGVFAVF